MTFGLSLRGFGRAAAATVIGAGVTNLAIPHRASGEEPLMLRCSLDTAPSHVRNMSVVDYLKQVEAATGGKITTEVFHSCRLYADISVGKTLLQDQVEMAVPGGWTQTGIVSDCDFVQLPAFYGPTIDIAHDTTDGKSSASVVSQLETRLRAKSLGPWLDLGFQNWYSTKKPLKTVTNFKGMKIRNPGGAGIRWRINLLGDRKYHRLAKRSARVIAGAGDVRRIRFHR